MNEAVRSWLKFRKKNSYYHQQIEELVSNLVPQHASILEIGAKGGEVLESLRNSNKVGLEENLHFYNFAKSQSPKLKIVNKWRDLSGKKFDYILLTHALSTTSDGQRLINHIKSYCHPKTRVVVLYFNFSWKPFLDFAEKFNFKMPESNQPNWLTSSDVHNLFYLESFIPVHFGTRSLCPVNLGPFSTFLNRFVSHLPLINHFDLINYSVYALSANNSRHPSVSIVIPARNEAGNMRGVLKRLPMLGKKTEVIFVEGNSSDNTYSVIKEEIAKYKGPLKCRLIKEKGKGSKGNAVRQGFSLAKNDLFIIFDADLTVDPSELPKFYNAFANGKGEFIMGSRLVYPMEKMAMRYLNFLGNKFFSLAFSYLLGQEIKDTLCGTKAILREDYSKIEKNRYLFGDFDPFGDFDLIFGAAKLNLRILEIPIRYKERTYGTTNISRFSHGMLLFKMTYFAAKNLKFI